MNHKKCQVILQVVKINSNNTYNIKINKYSGSCHNINDSYSELCIPNPVKNLNAEVFNLVSKNNERHISNETRHI